MNTFAMVARMLGGSEEEPLPPPARRPAKTKSRQPEPLGGTLKRTFDILVAGTALVIAAPLILILGCIIKLQDNGPIFYAHPRIGYDRLPFRCFKLRSMVMDGDAVLARHLDEDPAALAEWTATRKLRRDPRITPFGRFLRKTSLDELPQLLNIVRGDMSIVGPRPITQDELDAYGSAGRYYSATRPGLTGLWQISGRSDVDYDRRILLDTFYVRRWSMGRDVLIVLRTPAVILFGRGSY